MVKKSIPSQTQIPQINLKRATIHKYKADGINNTSKAKSKQRKTIEIKTRIRSKQYE